MLVHLRLNVPTDLTDEQRAAVESLAAADGDPRARLRADAGA